MLRLLAILLVLFSQLNSVRVIYPASAEISNGSQISVESVGPGQTFAVVVDPKVSTGGKHGIGGAYDLLVPLKLPSGWSGSPSKLYANPLQAEITVAKDAADGEYDVLFALWDEAGEQGLGDNLTFSAKVVVSSDVIGMKVEPSFLSVGAGQPARYTITVLNKGIANDIFLISSTGVSSWAFQRSVYIPAGTAKSITYEVVGNEEEQYNVRFSAKSASSDRISASSDVGLQVQTNLVSDWKAVNRGVLLFPIVQAPAFFFAGLLSLLF
ncbi:MAG: hypothetical protein N3G80_00230 [Candidatus Micrarchaeota archaeon]|nr:hypothetical protein [Candidatus Micrarchaeota archaeon]